VIDKGDRRFATVAHIPVVLRVWFEKQPVEDHRPVRTVSNAPRELRFALFNRLKSIAWKASLLYFLHNGLGGCAL
jgi:hypothetical protein